MNSMKENVIRPIIDENGKMIYATKHLNHTVIFNINEGPKVVDFTLNDIENFASDKSLFRVHKSHIVNINSIAEIKMRANGLTARLYSGKTIPVSKRRKNLLLEHLNIK